MTIYLDQICEMLDWVCAMNNEIFFLGDLNIDLSIRCFALRNRLSSHTDTFNLSQAVKKPTRICCRTDGSKCELLLI